MPVYVFGSGDCGQLGMGEDVVHAARPTAHPFFEDLLRTTGVEIVAVAAGGLHSLALSSHGDVYSWGCNDEKALGHAAAEFEVGRVAMPAGAKRVVQLCAGDSISAVLTEDGRVYTWGTFRGVMGHDHQGAATIQEQPTLLQPLSSLNVCAISAGANHLAALTADHQIYSWGCGEQGQLGRRVLERHKLLGLRPTNVTPRVKRAPVRIDKVVCGSYHTLAVSQGEQQGVYAMGLNNYGQLGLGDYDPRPNAEAIPGAAWRGEPIVELGAGEHHSLALSSSGTVFAFGRHDFGQLGITGLSERAMNAPHAVHGMPRIRQIAVGGNHNLAVAAETKAAVYSWGYGEMHQLGHGAERDERMPKEIVFAWRGAVKQAAAGGQHSIVLTGA